MNIWRRLFDKIFVINLESSKDRLEHIEKHLPSVGIDFYDVFPAIPAHDERVSSAIESNRVAQYPPCFRCGGLDCGDPNCNNFLTRPQIAVALTYRELWKKISELPPGRFLILEDDVNIQPDAADILEVVESKAQAGEIPFQPNLSCLLRLGWAKCAEHERRQEVKVTTDIRMSNPCHAITTVYAQKLFSGSERIAHTSDVYQHRLAPKKGEAWTIFPPLASELSWTDGHFESTIHPKQVRTQYLISSGEHDKAAENALKVANHIKKKHFRPLLIAGHPRCGTGYAAAVCRQLGVDVGHEKLGKDGISSWMFAVEADDNPYALDAASKTRRALAWDYLIMPTRNLTAAVGSVVRESAHAPPSHHFRREHILDSLGIDIDMFGTPFETAIVSVVSWTKIVHRQQPDLIFRIEDQHELLRHFLISKKIAGLGARDVVINTAPFNANKLYKGVRHPKPTFTESDWSALGENTIDSIKWYCGTFGYPLPPGLPQH